MSIKKLIIKLTLTAVFSAFLLTGCSKEANKSETICPFSDAVWSYSEDDIIKMEGTEYETYDSIYYGLTYSFKKEYASHPGTIKYMFDDKGNLRSIGWAYSTDDIDDLGKVYDEIYAYHLDKFGDYSYTAPGSDAAGNWGGVWYRDEGNIVLSCMFSSDNLALQCAYLHPEVSRGGK